MSDDNNVDEWWDCPVCGEPTRVCHGPRVNSKRECSACDWEFTLPGSPYGEVQND